MNNSNNRSSFNNNIVQRYVDPAYKSYQQPKNTKRYSRNSQLIGYEQYHNQIKGNSPYTDILVCPGKQPQILNQQQQVQQQQVQQQQVQQQQVLEEKSSIFGGFGKMFQKFMGKVAKNPKKIFTAEEVRDNKDARIMKKYRENHNSSTMVESHFNKHTGERITRSVNVTTEKHIGRPMCRFYQRGKCKFGDNCRYAHSQYEFC